MKELTFKVMSAVAPVFGVSISIAVLQAAKVPFPPALLWEAWPQWAVFAAVVHTFTALCMFIVSRVFGQAPISQPGGTKPAAAQETPRK